MTIKPFKNIIFLLIAIVLFSSFTSKPSVDWLSFEELEVALTEQPKKIVIYFYADWCVYCKKMEQSVYTKPEIQEALDKNYYAVKFNAESRDTIAFGGKDFINLNIGKQRNAYHQIPELLAGRKNKDLELPATVILDEEFNIIDRYYRYIPPKELLSILK